jgi:hypothetical protein
MAVVPTVNSLTARTGSWGLGGGEQATKAAAKSKTTGLERDMVFPGKLMTDWLVIYFFAPVLVKRQWNNHAICQPL